MVCGFPMSNSFLLGKHNPVQNIGKLLQSLTPKRRGSEQSSAVCPSWDALSLCSHWDKAGYSGPCAEKVEATASQTLWGQLSPPLLKILKKGSGLCSQTKVALSYRTFALLHRQLGSRQGTLEEQESEGAGAGGAVLGGHRGTVCDLKIGFG